MEPIEIISSTGERYIFQQVDGTCFTINDRQYDTDKLEHCLLHRQPCRHDEEKEKKITFIKKAVKAMSDYSDSDVMIDYSEIIVNHVLWLEKTASGPESD